MGEEETDGVIPESKIREAHAKCMEDPALAKYFNDAPPGAKEYIALMFYCTVFQHEVDDAQYEVYQKEVEEGLTREDVLYLATHERNLQTKAHFRELLAQMPPVSARMVPPPGGMMLPPMSPMTFDEPEPVVVDTRRLELAVERVQSTLQRIEEKLEAQEAQAAKFRTFRFACQVVWLAMVVLVALVGAMALCWHLMPKQ